MKLFLFLVLSLPVVGQLTESNLPLIYINTEGRTILNEPKIKADIKIIYDENGGLNKPSDKAHYEGMIGIELRGSSSQGFPKKPYGFETWQSEGVSLDTSLLGYPKDNDWILFASYNEKSLLHNVLTMNLAQKMGQYASRTKYVELFVNNEYQGVYVLMEKIKRGNGRVDISKLEPTEESGRDLTGGYIIKIDKDTGSRIGSWNSNISNRSDFFKPSTFFYEYPKDITPTQKTYIRNYVHEFENALAGPNYRDPLAGYRKYIDTQSFVVATMLNEVSKNVDGYRISTYLYKEKDREDTPGRLHLGPVWDYDISYGNGDYCEGWKPEGFAYHFNKVCPQDFYQVPFWWTKFFEDPYFVSEFRASYDFQRTSGILKQENLFSLIDSLANVIRVPQERNFKRWPILGTYVWPSPQPIPSTWQGEIDELKAWLSKRLIWLDQNFPKEYTILSTVDTQRTIQVYPNPFVEVIHLEINAAEKETAAIKLWSITGQRLFEKYFDLNVGYNAVKIDVNPSVVGNNFILEVNKGGKKETWRLSKQ